MRVEYVYIVLSGVFFGLWQRDATAAIFLILFLCAILGRL